MRMALVVTAVLAMAAAPALAAGGTAKNAGDQKAAEGAQDPVTQELRSAENPHVAVIEQRARELVAPLSQPQMKDLFLMRESYGLIRSVEIVQRDISRAVRLCGEDNADLKDPMAARLKKWNGTVDPVLKERMAALQSAIDDQDFAKPEKIRSYFKSLDDAAVYAEKKFDKRVVTTPEACKGLLQSMDGTQNEVANIMKDLKVPEFAAGNAEPTVPKDPAPAKKAD